MKSKPHLVDVQVGQAIKYQRLMKRMSQTELGDRVGVSFQQIQKYEKGSNRISAGKLVDLAKALDVDVKTFFDDLTEVTRSAKNISPANDEFV
ncbi:MAG: helix-turn-helix transcriptional regulator, partial [Rhizobiaceae bacterium]|nr:helix-turn-helix transcriptional regulator [Rhizobiaceae bacterium]